MSPFSSNAAAIEPAPAAFQPETDAPAPKVAEKAPEAIETEAEEAIETPEAKVAPTGKTALKKALRELKLKVDGKEYSEKLPFDLPDDPAAIEYMQKQLQMSKMGQSRAQQSAELQKEFLSFIEELKSNPKKALANPMIGVDLKKLAVQVIEEDIENSKKSPDQLEKEKLQAEIKELREKQELDKKDWEEKEFSRLQEVEYDRYESKMVKALEGSDLPKSPYVVKKMAEYMLLGLQEGKNLDPEDVLPLVRDEISSDIKEMFAAMPDEVIEGLIGKDKIESLRKKKIAKAKTPPPTPVAKQLQDVAKTVKKAASAPGKKQSYKDFFKM